MKYIDEYRNKELVKSLIDAIHRHSKQRVAFMEVCGGHTMAIQKFGIPSMLPDTIELKSGPGCPVCVSSRKYIDTAVTLSRQHDVIITTYGDLIRVPGSSSNLDKEKAAGQDIRIVYSVLDALAIAQKNPDKQVIFLGIGFETTAPSSAAAILHAGRNAINNFYLFSAHKIMPPAMSALVDEGVKINGYLCPGHVSTITGSSIYQKLADDYGMACVVSGFEPTDILQSILMLVKQVEESKPKVEIQYTRAVKPEGNPKAQSIMNNVFHLQEDWWRGLGNLPSSGLQLNEKYESFDALKQFDVEVEETREPKGCICGEVLKGTKNPHECSLFADVCNPGNPIGACMVSHEGACHAYFKYNR